MVSCLVAACSGSTVDKGTAPGVQCDSGNCPSLTGTWEVVGSRLGDVQKSALVTVSAGSLVVTTWKGNFQALQHGNTFDMSFVGGSTYKFAAARTEGPGNTGIIPLPLFGEWDAHAANSPGCTVSVKPDVASASCSKASGLPDWMELNGTATLQATRTSTLASQFGDFGGDWTFTTGVGASCSIRVEGQTISATCTNARNATGNASLTLDGDTGHGSTSAGIEFTAQRR
jgi:hypothetical protein